MRNLKVKEIYEKLFDSVMEVTLPCEVVRPQALKYVNDSYRNRNSKNNARANIGEITKTCFCGEFKSKNVPIELLNSEVAYLKYSCGLIALLKNKLFHW